MRCETSYARRQFELNTTETGAIHRVGFVQAAEIMGDIVDRVDNVVVVQRGSQMPAHVRRQPPIASAHEQ